MGGDCSKFLTHARATLAYQREILFNKQSPVEEQLLVNFFDFVEQPDLLEESNFVVTIVS